MNILSRALSVACLASSFAAPAVADDFKPVTAKSEFVNLIDGRELTSLGVRLSVSPAGAIKGSAFGYDVRGAWRWQGDYFCRDLAYGSTDLGPNCQLVLVKGDTLRFVSDQGQGQSADLRLR